eukprot:jgi/Orpsp1_1/1176814/evm.model.c7180000059139.1
MNKYPRKTQNVITHYVKTLPSNVIPKFPQLFIEFIKYYFNEQTDDISNNNNSSSIICSNENIKASPPNTFNIKNPLHRNSNSHLTNSKRNSSNSSLSTFAHNKNAACKSNSSIPLSRAKSIQSTYNNSINSIPSSYSETSSYYYNNHKRSLPGNLCLIAKAAEFSEVQITLRELFLDLYNDDLLSQYFYPIFIDFSHENIFALWLKEDEDDNYSSQNSTYWGLNSFQTTRSNTKHTSLMSTQLGIGSNLLTRPVSIGSLPIVKIGLEKQRIAVIAKNLNSFLSLLTQTSFVNNIVRNYRIGGGDESTILSSEGSSDEEYNSIQDMMRFDDDILENDISSTSSTISLEGVNNKLSGSSDDLIESSFLNDEDVEEDDIENNDNEFEDEKETVKDEKSQENSNEQFSIEVESNEGDDEREDFDSNNDNDKSDNEISNKKGKKENNEKHNRNSVNTIKEGLKENDEIINVISENENKPESENKIEDENENENEIEIEIENETKNNIKDKSNKEEMDQLDSDSETLSSSITDRHNHCHRNNGFGYDSDVKIKSQNDSIDIIINDNSLPNSFPNNKRFTEDYEKMNKSEMNIRRYSYASSINSTLTTVSASPFAIRTMFQQQETQICYNQWYDEICKRDNINLDNSDEIEKKLLNNDNTVLRSPSISSMRSNNRKYFSMDSYQLNKAYYDNKQNVKPISELPPSSSVLKETDKNRKQKSSKSKKSNNKLSVKSISHTLQKSATQAPKQIKRRLKENASLQKLKLDGSLLPNKSKNKEVSNHHHSSQKSSSPYTKKLMNSNELLPPPSSALSKNISSSSRAKISSPLSQRNHQEGYLKPRKNVPTTVTTMMTISNNLNHTHNSSVVSKTSPKIPSKLHQNLSVNRYRTNSSPAPIYSSKSNSRIISKDNGIRQNYNIRTLPTTMISNSNVNASPSIDNKENINTKINTNTTTDVTTTKINKQQPESLQINTSLSKKDSKDSVKTATPKTAPPFFNTENSIFNNLFGTKKFTKFNGLNFLTNIPIVAKLLNLDKDNDSNNNNNNNNNNNSNNNDTNQTTEANKSSKENQDNNKNNLPINISRQGSAHKYFEKSPEKSTFSTYTNNSGNINYISSSTLALQILEKERKGIPEPEQWLQKQVKARAYAIAVANAVAKRNTQKNNNDYSQYTTKFTPTNHLHTSQRQPKASVETTTVTTSYRNDSEKKSLVEDDDFFML